jgi:hypothetical protein
MKEVIFNIKNNLKTPKKVKRLPFEQRYISKIRDNLNDGFYSDIDPAIEGLDSNYDNRLELELKSYDIN